MGVSIYVCPRQEFSKGLTAAVRVVETAMHTLAGQPGWQPWLCFEKKHMSFAWSEYSQLFAACQAINAQA